MTANATRRPVALTKLLERAQTKPIELPAELLDEKSTIRREFLGDMPIGELLALTGHNRAKEHVPHRLQRDTESRLSTALRSAHLRNVKSVPTPQHHVSLVWFRNKLEVVDGNTRLALWSGHAGEEVLAPASVLVTIYYPADEAEYDELYRCFDSNEARKTNQDNLYGMLRAIGITPTSELLRRNKVVSAICLVAGVPHSPERLFEGVQTLAKPLQDLDSYNFSAAPQTSYSAGVYAGLLSLLQQGRKRQAVAAFAKELKNCREKDDYVSSSAAVKEFLKTYPEAKAVSAGMAIKRVRELTEQIFDKFEEEYAATHGVKASGTVRTRVKKAA